MIGFSSDPSRCLNKVFQRHLLTRLLPCGHSTVFGSLAINRIAPEKCSFSRYQARPRWKELQRFAATDEGESVSQRGMVKLK